MSDFYTAEEERDDLALLLDESYGREKVLEERALRAEAQVEEWAKKYDRLEAAKDAAIGGLLELVEHPFVNGGEPGIHFCSCWDIGRSANCHCGYERRRREAAAPEPLFDEPELWMWP